MVRVATTRIFGEDFPLPAHPAPRAGTVQRATVTSAEDVSFQLGDETSLVEILVKGGEARWLEGADGDLPDDGQTLVAAYHSKSVTRGETLRFRAVSADVTVEIVEA